MVSSATSRRDSGTVVLGSAFSRVVGLGSMLLAAYLLSPEAFGVFGFALTTAALIAGLGGLALPAIVTREVSQNPDTARGTLSAAVFTMLSATMAVSVVGLLLVAVFRHQVLPAPILDEPVGIIAFAVVVSAIGQALNALSIAALLAQRRFRLWSGLSILRALAVGGAAGLAALTGQATVVLCAAAFAELGSAIASFAIGRQVINVRINRQLMARAGQLFRISWAPGLASQAIQGAAWFGLLLLARQPEGLVLVAWFSLSLRIVTGSAFLPQSIVTAHLPEIHRSAIARSLRGTVVRTTRDSMIAAGLVAAAVALCAPLVGLLGTGYSGATVVLQVLCISIPLMTLNMLSGSVALALHRNRLWAVSDFVLAITYLAAALICVPLLSATGLAVASVVSYLATTTFLVAGLLWVKRTSLQR